MSQKICADGSQYEHIDDLSEAIMYARDSISIRRLRVLARPTPWRLIKMCRNVVFASISYASLFITSHQVFLCQHWIHILASSNLDWNVLVRTHYTVQLGASNHQLVTLRTRVDFTPWQLWLLSLYFLRPAQIIWYRVIASMLVDLYRLFCALCFDMSGLT